MNHKIDSASWVDVTTPAGKNNSIASGSAVACFVAPRYRTHSVNIMLKAILFDFDGVIMDTMNHKLDAYAYALAEYGFPADEIHRLVLLHMGQSRHRIIRIIHEELLEKPIPEECFKAALARFNRRDDEARPNMQFVPGSLEFIRAIHRDYFTAVVTGTPETVIRQTTAFHELDQYFNIVRGSPDRKTEIIASLLSESSFQSGECVFIGDGKTDQDAADHHEIRFAGIHRELSSFDPEKAWRTVEDLNQLIPLPT